MKLSELIEILNHPTIARLADKEIIFVLPERDNDEPLEKHEVFEEFQVQTIANQSVVCVQLMDNKPEEYIRRPLESYS